MKVLNLYAGIGGNRKLWKDVEVTAVEWEPEIAAIYKDFFPEDMMVIGDAHQYLLDHFKEFDFIWASPPCPTHSKVRFANQNQNKPIFPSMKLYEEILFLQHYFKGKWVVENVISYYDPLIKPYEFGGHYFWSNFHIAPFQTKNRCHNGTVKELQKRKGFDLSKYKTKTDKIKILRNCVESELGKHIFNSGFKCSQLTLKWIAKQRTTNKLPKPTKSLVKPYKVMNANNEEVSKKKQKEIKGKYKDMLKEHEPIEKAALEDMKEGAKQ